jgi:hypothetical protein
MYDNGNTVSSQYYSSSPDGAKMAIITMPKPDNNVIAIYNTAVGPTIPHPNCCGTTYYKTCTLGNYPCNDNITVANIVPNQHFFDVNFNSFYFTGSITTQNVDIFLNDLNPAKTYDLFLNTTKQQTITPSSTTQGFIKVTANGITTGLANVCVEVSGTGLCATLKNPTAKSAINSSSHVFLSFFQIITIILILIF